MYIQCMYNWDSVNETENGGAKGWLMRSSGGGVALKAEEVVCWTDVFSPMLFIVRLTVEVDPFDTLVAASAGAAC